MPAPERIPEDLYVERSETREALESTLKEPGVLVVGDMRGAHGVGKTTVLSQLYHQLRSENAGLPLSWIDLSEFGDADRDLAAPLMRRRDAERDPDQRDDRDRALEDLRQTRIALESYRRLLIALDRDLHAGGKQDEDDCYALRFQKKGLSALLARIHLRELEFTPTPPFVSLKTDIERHPPKITADTLVWARLGLTATLARRVKKLLRAGVPVLFFDNFCHIEKTVLENWLLEELIPALPRCRIIIGRNDYQHRLSSTSPPNPIPIGNFSAAESRAYVAKVLGQEALAQGWDGLIFEYSQGHPLSTSLLVEIIRERGARQEAPEAQLRALLTDIPRSEPDRIGKLDREFVDLIRQRDHDLAEAIDAACVLRDFDIGTLTFVLRGEITADEVEDLWRRLRRLPVVKNYTTEEKEQRIVFHELFARGREAWLLQERREFVDHLHQDAAAYYRQLLQSAEEESTEGVWGRLHLCENERWQTWNRHWLRHLTASSDSAPAGLEVATRFFDAFFWWGEYMPFPFCRTLLEDIASLDLSENHIARKWLDPLREFLQAYPPKRRQPEHTEWGLTRAVLGKLWDRAHLGNIDEQDATRWHLRGILQNYIADAWAAEDINDPRAETAYKASIEAFEKAAHIYHEHLQDNALNPSARKYFTEQQANETWYGIWMQIWLAGFYAQTGRYDLALKISQRAEVSMRDIAADDIEALARVECARGDAYFGKERWDAAIHEYALYALDSLGFLVDSYSERYDPYTVEFFREMIEHVAAKLIEMHKRDAQLAARWWSQLRSFWLPAGAYLLPEGSDNPPKEIEAAIVRDARGQVVSHRLPLPTIPFQPQEWLDDEVLPLISQELRQRIPLTYRMLKEKCDRAL